MTYTIDAPISGTIVDKKVKAGDKLSANDTAMQNLCTIYDMSHLEMKLNVDELKIRSLKVGQEVDITADAVPGETYKGVISSILVAAPFIFSRIRPLKLNMPLRMSVLPGHKK